ncbi:MAG TPA: magnesium and cobalt transport protein [Microscillaceae bacterium]|nr:magnesium and cobalt transport protein [Microscillaceae bacterium]
MIEVFYKNTKQRTTETLESISPQKDEILNIRLIDFTSEELQGIANKFDLHVGYFHQKEDIEISSHYVDLHDQVSITISVPSYTSDTSVEEKDMYIIIKDSIFFTFMPVGIEEKINLLTKYRYDIDQIDFKTYQELFAFQIGVITDYFADIVESVSAKIKKIFSNTLKSSQFTQKDLDTLTEINFSNYLILESMSEFQRILMMLRRKFATETKVVKKLSAEIRDLRVISEHINNNFERINDLKLNVGSKIELEQNNIFKILTIITVCISIPTLIAGIYGMNFKNMPELSTSYGYPLAWLAILLGFILPLLYFKRKKWF